MFLQGGPQNCSMLHCHVIKSQFMVSVLVCLISRIHRSAHKSSKTTNSWLDSGASVLTVVMEAEGDAVFLRTDMS